MLFVLKLIDNAFVTNIPGQVRGKAWVIASIELIDSDLLATSGALKGGRVRCDGGGASQLESFASENRYVCLLFGTRMNFVQILGSMKFMGPPQFEQILGTRPDRKI